MRSASKTDDVRNLFVTYRGFGVRKCSKDRSERIVLNPPSMTDSDDNRINWILPDVPFCSQNASEASGCDSRSLFSSVLAGGSLIDIGLHGAFPTKPQCLDPLKTAILEIIRNGYNSPLPKVDGLMNDFYNILLRQKRFDQFQYLLFLSKPVECGQTVKVCFPSITATLQNENVSRSEHSNMHMIDESIRTLCLEDLRSLITWLADEVLNSLGEIPHENADHNFKSFGQRIRLYWIGRRVFSAIGQRQLPSDVKIFESLCFSSQTYMKKKDWIDLTDDQKTILALNTWTQIEVELRYSLDQDISCGTHTRSGWSSKSQFFFENVLSAAAKCIDRSLEDEAQWSLFTTFIENFKKDSHLNSVDIPSNILSSVERLDSGLFDQCANTVERFGSQSSEKSPGEISKTDGHLSVSNDISDDLIWQIVNLIFETVRLDFSHIDISDMLQSILSSVHSIIFDEDSIVMDPQPLRYREVLSVPLTLSCPDADFLPKTYDLFLGLVWPALRNCGWRIFVGAALDDVTFIPKSMSRKRWDMMRRLQGRQSLNVDRTLKYGVHSLSKTTKRLFLAVSSESVDSGINDMSIDVVNDPTRSTKAVFDRFGEGSLSQFENSSNEAKHIAEEVIRNAIHALEECFDSCAAMLVPIPSLPPSTDVDGHEKIRPVDAYQSEYLLPFLFSLLSIKELKSTPGGSMNEVVINDDFRAFICDVLYYLSIHFKDLFHERFHPPFEEYVVADGTHASKSSLWIESHVHSRISKIAPQAAPLPINGDDMDTTEEVISEALDLTNNTGSINQLFEVIVGEDKDQLTDFIRVVLENSVPFYASEEDVRRKSGRALGAPGLACRHCFSKSTEGKYMFSTVESLSACYPVLEKHMYKCAYTPNETKQLIQKARSLHSQQRKERAPGSQQGYFTQLWYRMNKNKPLSEAPNKSRALNPPIVDGRKDGSDGESEDDFDAAIKGSSLEDVNLTDHLKVLDFLRKNLNKLPKNSRQDIQNALDTYYSCVDYAGRVYGTHSMPQHFSPRWLLQKMRGFHERSESSKHYVG